MIQLVPVDLIELVEYPIEIKLGVRILLFYADPHLGMGWRNKDHIVELSVVHLVISE